MKRLALLALQQAADETPAEKKKVASGEGKRHEIETRQTGVAFPQIAENALGQNAGDRAECQPGQEAFEIFGGLLLHRFKPGLLRVGTPERGFGAAARFDTLHNKIACETLRPLIGRRTPMQKNMVWIAVGALALALFALGGAWLLMGPMGVADFAVGLASARLPACSE